MVGTKVFEYERGDRSLQSLSDWIEKNEYETQASEQRTISEQETSLMEQIASNPQMLITIMVVVVVVVVALLGVILCCCMDEDEEMKMILNMNKDGQQKSENRKSSDEDARLLTGEGAAEIRKRIDK